MSATRIVIDRAISLYQAAISPLIGPRCRFYPSCSEYARCCYRDYPLGKATAKTLLRLLKCQPLHPGGVDLP